MTPPQVPSPSLCCRGKSCSEMSTTSTRTCLSGNLTCDIQFAPHLLVYNLTLAYSLILLLSVAGYRMAFSYFVGGKCITQNRNSMVSMAEICLQGPSFCNEAASNYPHKPHNFCFLISLFCKSSSVSIFHILYCCRIFAISPVCLSMDYELSRCNSCLNVPVIEGHTDMSSDFLLFLVVRPQGRDPALLDC